MKRIIPFVAIFIFQMLFSTNTWCADLKKGGIAYKNGDYPAALREWKPLAFQGNAKAQFFLGNMYYKGIGVPQDDGAAYKWFKKAAEQGANIILLQELFQTPYFCIEYDENIFRLAKEFENNPLLEIEAVDDED